MDNRKLILIQIDHLLRIDLHLVPLLQVIHLKEVLIGAFLRYIELLHFIMLQFQSGKGLFHFIKRVQSELGHQKVFNVFLKGFLELGDVVLDEVGVEDGDCDDFGVLNKVDSEYFNLVSVKHILYNQLHNNFLVVVAIVTLDLEF